MKLMNQPLIISDNHVIANGPVFRTRQPLPDFIVALEDWLSLKDKMKELREAGVEVSTARQEVPRHEVERVLAWAKRELRKTRQGDN